MELNLKKWFYNIGRRIMAYAGPEYMGMPVNRWFNMTSYGSATDAGIYVDPEVAKKASVVFACIRILAGSVSSSPRQIFSRTGPINREPNTKHPLYKKLHTEPNPFMSAAVFFETAVSHIFLHGEMIAWTPRNRGGGVESFFLLDPRDVEVEKQDDRLKYIVKTAEKGYRTIDQDDIIHVPNIFVEVREGIGRQYRGMPTIAAGAQPIGLALAAEKHTASYLKNGILSNVVVSYPREMKRDLQEETIKFLKEHYGGDQKGSPLVLTQGGQAESLVIDAEKAQLLQSREYSVVDIGSRLFGLPPHLVGAIEKQTSWGSGIEQMGIGMVVFTLNPLIVRIEQEFNRKLFRDGRNFLEFNLDGLVRGDMKARYESYQIALGGNQMPGFMSKNEIRKLQNLPPVEGGDEIYNPPEREAASGQGQNGDDNGSSAATSTIVLGQRWSATKLPD